MAYVTKAELKASLADAGGAGARTAASLPDGRLQVNVDEATGEVAGRLRRSFTLPDPGPDANASPPSTPALLKTIIVGIAGYLATLEFYGSQPVEERDPVVLRYARAEKLLDQVAKGDLELELELLEGNESPTGSPAIFQPPGQANIGLAEVFNPDAYPSHPNMAPYTGGTGWE